MSKVECPICHQEHDEDIACPCCSFEFHHSFSISKHFQEIEQKRIAAHSEWWKDLSAKKIDLKKYEQKVEELRSATTHISELELTLTSKEQELNDLRQELSKEKEKSTQLESEKQSLENEVGRLKGEVSNLTRTIADLNKKVEAQSKEIEEKDRKIKELENLIATSSYNQPFGYIIVKQGNHFGQVLPFYKDTTIVGRNPQQTEGSNCKIETSCRDLKNKHFKLTVTQDDKVMVQLLEGCAWEIKGQGTKITECEIDNGTNIIIGSLTLIINYM